MPEQQLMICRVWLCFNGWCIGLIFWHSFFLLQKNTNRTNRPGRKKPQKIKSAAYSSQYHLKLMGNIPFLAWDMTIQLLLRQFYCPLHVGLDGTSSITISDKLMRWIVCCKSNIQLDCHVWNEYMLRPGLECFKPPKIVTQSMFNDDCVKRLHNTFIPCNKSHMQWSCAL